MSLPKVVSQEEWRAARIELLAEEKAMTRARDALNVKRRELPMVAIEKDYVFQGPSGDVGLVDLFEGRRQLIVGHFMFDPSWDDGCPSCSAGADEVSPGLLDHLHARDTTLADVSRAPLHKLERWKAHKGWTFPWYSSLRAATSTTTSTSRSTSRWPPTSTTSAARTSTQRRATSMVEAEQPFEMPGTSYFLRDGDRVFHTYSTYARGAEQTGGSYYFLDLTALGRQEEWEEPKGRAASAHAASPDFAA